MPTPINFFEINGTDIFYTDRGAGFPIVFVHAGIADSRMWEDQIEFFSKEFRAISYDMRGFGSSPLAQGEYSHHEDLIALLKKLNIDRCVLVGCSKGGGVIIDTALANPSRVSGLVVVAGIANGLELQNGPEPPAQWDQLIKAFKEGNLEVANELEVQMWVDGYNQPLGRADEQIREKVRNMNAIVLQNEVNALETKQNVLEPMAVTRLGELLMPVLFMSGKLDDPYIIQAIETMLPQIPQAEHLVLEDVAHLPNLESPEIFKKYLDAFMRKVGHL